PACGTQVAAPKTKPAKSRRFWSLRTLTRVVIALLSTGVFQLYRPYIFHYAARLMPLAMSPLVSEAVDRANGNKTASAAVGAPMKSSWFVKGGITEDETGWSEAQLRIPVHGEHGEGTLYARAGKSDGPWVFSELALTLADGKVINFLEPPTSLGSNLKSYGRPYLVPIGKFISADLPRLVAYYEKALGLTVELLPELALDDRVRDRERGQLIAEELIELMRRRLPKLANDPNAILLGITDEDIYIRDYNWPFALNLREGQRFGVLSSYRLKLTGAEIKGGAELIQTRVRKLVSKNIGALVYRLPLSNDPTSLMYTRVWSAKNVDTMVESFEGLGARAVVDDFTTAHTRSPEKVELLPNVPDISTVKPDGRYPCLLAKKASQTEASPKPYQINVSKCLPRALLDSDVDEIEIDLRFGLVMTRSTDLFLAGDTPVAVTRCYRLWDDTPRAFGRGAALSWDMFPLGERNPYTYVFILTCDGSRFLFDRISKGTGYADALYEHRQTATPFFGARFGWNGNGWDVKLGDGTFLLFPESYYAKRGVDGALTGFRDANGRPIQIERDRRRNLLRLTAPGGRWVRFDYDSSDRVIRASDDKNRIIKYDYDAGGRLFQVTNGTQSRTFEYNRAYLMSIDENDRRLVDFRYTRGRIREMSFADGRTYKYRYDFDPRDDYTITRTYLTHPDGLVAKFDIKSE
ncbi:MAG: cytochrome c oxidase assembly factor Coa1 family protein, partial [Candidatus Binatia bacterium]